MTVCNHCGPKPTTVTLTKPVEYAPTSAPAMTTSTVYTTKLITVTACPYGVPNCPAESATTSTVTSVVALYTTVCPVTEVATPTSTTTLYSTHTVTQVITKHVYSNTAVPIVSSALAHPVVSYPVVSSVSAYPVVSYPVVSSASAYPAVSYPVVSSASAYPVVSYPAVSSASVYPISSANYTSAVTKVLTMSVVPIPYKEVNGTSSAPYGYVAATGVTVSASETPAYTTSAPAQYTGAASRASVGMSVVAVLVAGFFAL